MRFLIFAAMCLAIPLGAFAQNFPVNNITVAGTATIKAPSPLASTNLRAALSTAPTIYVDQTDGTDYSGCGMAAGTAACKTIQTAVNNLCGNFDLRATDGTIPTVMLAGGETYSTALVMQASDETSPVCVGIHEIELDSSGSTPAIVDQPGYPALYLRYVPMLVRVHNVILENTGSTGNIVLVRGAGSMVELDGAVTIGALQNSNAYAQLEAGDFGYITSCPTNTCPEDTSNTIVPGGGYFALADTHGLIALEGTTFNFSAAGTYSQAVFGGDSGGAVTLSQVTWSGTNPTGLNYAMQLNSQFKTAAQTGSFGACAGNTYLPGTSCGQLYSGAAVDTPGTLTVTGAGTGATIQGTEPAFRLLLGSGLTTTSGTQVGPVSITMATATNYQECTATTNDPGSVSNLKLQWTGPTGAAPNITNGYLQIYWTATGFDPSGKVIWVSCRGD